MHLYICALILIIVIIDINLGYKIRLSKFVSNQILHLFGRPNSPHHHNIELQQTELVAVGYYFSKRNHYNCDN